MRFVINSQEKNSATASACVQRLSRELRSLGHDTIVNDWHNYGAYDVALFTAYDFFRATPKDINPKILIGIIDPKPGMEERIGGADFCIVGSIEQREHLMRYNRNQFIYYMIPEFDAIKVSHVEKKRYTIAYHGNKIHLNGSYATLVPALNELGKKYSIQFDAVYDVKSLGRWSMGRPDSNLCPTRDLQWYPNCYKDYFQDADIGVVQNQMPLRQKKIIRRLSVVSERFLLENKSDHILKFKSSCNAGRAFIFGYFGIPVVADAVPSLGDVIVDGSSGRLVMSPEGWFDALEDLICSAKLRQEFADNFLLSIKDRFSPRKTAARLVKYIENLRPKEKANLCHHSPSIMSEYIELLKRDFV